MMRDDWECVNGHQYTEENTYTGKNGHRHCRACNRIQQNRRRAAHLAEDRKTKRVTTPVPVPAPVVLHVVTADTEAWREYALCGQADPEAFFPPKGGSTLPAKSICARCEVRTQCLEYALANNETEGIWGGLSEQERKQLTRQNTA